MSETTTVLHVRGQTPDAVEAALEAIFAGEERARALRIQGSYSAVLTRATAPELETSYSYVILRPHTPSQWTPILEVGNRTEGLDVELSRRLGGAPVFTTFVYGDGLSGYRLARDGAAVDRYASDPTYYTEAAAEDADVANDQASGAATEDERALIERERGHPERFADLLPEGTSPEEFARVVLRPGWWEEHDAAGAAAAHEAADEQDEQEEWVDEADRMRCIGLALELWGPAEYPFAQDPEEISNVEAGPAIALAFT
ncbi:MAG: hypothetical protein ACXVCX_12215 [Ktedonobacterales bacterium]